MNGCFVRWLLRAPLAASLRSPRPPRFAKGTGLKRLILGAMRVFGAPLVLRTFPPRARETLGGLDVSSGGWENLICCIGLEAKALMT